MKYSRLTLCSSVIKWKKYLAENMNCSISTQSDWNKKLNNIGFMIFILYIFYKSEETCGGLGQGEKLFFVINPKVKLSFQGAC